MSNLRTRSGFWMEAVVAFNETNEKGLSKEVKERYVIEASSFIDGEQRIRDEFSYANKPIKTISNMIRPKYGTITFSDDSEADNFYKVKVCISEEVEVRTRKGGTRTKTKVVSHFHLVQAASVEGARQAVKEDVYKNSNEDFEIADIVKTRILDILEHDKHMQKTAAERGTEE